MANNAVQVILNADNFITTRETNTGGSQKEHFPHQDKEFAEHKSALIQQVSAARTAVSGQSVDLAYAKVTLRRSALAKTNRPFSAVFNPEYTPIVGGQDLGQILVQVTTSALEHVEREINKSNPITRTRINPKTQKPYFAPNVQRSETGGIANISLYGPTDRVTFSAEYAVAAFADPRRAGTYYVELFELIPQLSEWDTLPPNLIRLFASFEEGLRSLGDGVQVERLDQTDSRSPFLSIRLLTDDAPTIMPFSVAAGVPIWREPQKTRKHEVDLSISRHHKLLALLRSHVIVRSVRIAPTFMQSAAQEATIRQPPTALVPFIPKQGTTYPLVGVIDGGIGTSLRPWVVATLNYLQPADRDERHGTFIAGLLVHGQSLNGPEVCPEADGCHLVDIDIFPSENNPNTFQSYFPSGSKDFFEALEESILRCRVDHGVRIFNLSINGDDQASLKRYSPEARKLDAIAQATDVIIVVSAGNVDLASRPEWPNDAITALSDLAITRDDTLQIPAETVSNVSVSALNPPGVARALAHAPAAYSRRGPGLRSGLKPDFCHYGGAKVQAPVLSSGLFSIDPGGLVVEDHGTSFAAPLIAKTFAALDAKIQGDVSRETLIALVAHYSEIRSPLDHPALKNISRHLVGHGIPQHSDDMLSCADHQITLVFAARLKPGKILRFPFAWPRSLVDENGKCRGRGRMTLVFSPPLNHAFGAEFVRVNLEAALQQETPATNGWGGHAHQRYMEARRRTQSADEAELITDGLKWSTVKQYTFNMARGVGTSSNWRIQVDYLERNFTAMPNTGVPFTLLLTIEDPKAEATGVFNDLRLWLQTTGATISDIRTAARIGTRT